MRATALKVISVARTENATFTVNRYFETAAENDPAFLAVVNQRNNACIRTGLVPFPE